MATSISDITMSIKTLNLTPELYDYYQAHAYREPEVLAALRQETLKRFPNSAHMEISPEQGQLMHLLIKLIQANRVLEIGTFTGYSALWMALALSAEGKLITCDIDEATSKLAQDFWHKAGLTQQIELKLGPARATLEDLIQTGYQDSFDFAFIDADKTGYDHYYEQCLLLVKPGGLIAIDNTLQSGRVVQSEDHSPNTKALLNLNDKILKDSRVSMCMLPISDGLTIAYKL